MNVAWRLLAACILAAVLTGCAYVEYRRVYELHPRIAVQQRASVIEAIERYLIDKGLRLKQKYRDLHPQDRFVSALEIPRIPQEKRRHPFLLVIFADDGIVQFIHQSGISDAARTIFWRSSSRRSSGLFPRPSAATQSSASPRPAGADKTKL
jgi:hypothetical protein